MVVARGYPDSVGSGGIRVTLDSCPRRAALQEFIATKKEPRRAAPGKKPPTATHSSQHTPPSAVGNCVEKRGGRPLAMCRRLYAAGARLYAGEEKRYTPSKICGGMSPQKSNAPCHVPISSRQKHTTRSVTNPTRSGPGVTERDTGGKVATYGAGTKGRFPCWKRYFSLFRCAAAPRRGSFAVLDCTKGAPPVEIGPF